MNREIAEELVSDLRVSDGQESYTFHDSEIVALILWAYDQGWTESRDDLKESYNPTDKYEFNRSR